MLMTRDDRREDDRRDAVQLLDESATENPGADDGADMDVDEGTPVESAELDDAAVMPVAMEVADESHIDVEVSWGWIGEHMMLNILPTGPGPCFNILSSSYLKKSLCQLIFINLLFYFYRINRSLRQRTWWMCRSDTTSSMPVPSEGRESCSIA